MFWLRKDDTRLTTLDETAMVVVDNFHKKNVIVNGIKLHKFNEDLQSVSFIYGSEQFHIRYHNTHNKKESYISVSTSTYGRELLRLYKDFCRMYIKSDGYDGHHYDIPYDTFNEIDFFQYEVGGVTNPLSVPVLCKLKDKMKELLDAIK